MVAISFFMKSSSVHVFIVHLDIPFDKKCLPVSKPTQPPASPGGGNSVSALSKFYKGDPYKSVKVAKHFLTGSPQ
jgi:hypothetical protein